MPLSEYEIERKVESMFDQLDKEYLSTDMAPGEYNRRTQEIHKWAMVQYAIAEGVWEC